MSYHTIMSNKIKELVYLLDTWLSAPTDKVQIQDWLNSANSIVDTFEFSERDQAYVDTMLDMYEEQFEQMILLQTPQQIPIQYLDELLSKTQTEQRTEAWYKQMSTIISASELGNLFASPYQRSKFVVAKSQPYQSRQQDTAIPSSRMSAFDWGIRFEPVVKQIYEYKYGCTVKELGRLTHPVDTRCAASPDGLVYHCPEGKRQGRLIEIKCPVTREIDGSVPKDYYHQMQMQLHVTGLQLCDYVEASFESVYNRAVKKKDGANLYHGYIALMRYEKPTNGQEFYYVYSPVNSDASWSPIVDSEEDLIEIIPWNLYKWNEQIIERSEDWWKTTHPLIEAFWQDVERHKRGEFTVLESNRPVKKMKPAEKCMITFTRMDYTTV